MPKICKVCELPAQSYTVFSDVCDGCIRYDWGHWKVKRARYHGLVFGVIVSVLAGYDSPWHRYPAGWLGFGFLLLAGALAGMAAFEALASWLFNRYLTRAEPSPHPEERAQEAEKFFYLALISAFQGKKHYALRMLRLAHRHGWRQWEMLTADPRFAAFCRLPAVQMLFHA